MNSKLFLLQQDLIENRKYQLFSNNILVTQENGTNPRIRRMSDKSRNEFITVSESLPDYSARVILGNNQPILRVSNDYKIKFSDTEIIDCRCIDIKKSYEQDVYVTLYLVKK
jgi:hypothetical protein